MKRTLALALSLITASTSFAADLNCPIPLTSNVLVGADANSRSALVFQRFESGRIVFKSCQVLEKSPEQVTVNMCTVLGSEMGYSPKELMDVSEALNSNRALQVAVNSAIFIAASVAGVAGGTWAGYTFGPSGGHGLMSGLSAVYGAAIGMLAGPVCGGILAKISANRQKGNRNLKNAVSVATELASQSNILVTQDNVSSTIVNLGKALALVK